MKKIIDLIANSLYGALILKELVLLFLYGIDSHSLCIVAVPG